MAEELPDRKIPAEAIRMNEETLTPFTLEELQEELRRVKYREGFRFALRNTIYGLITVAAVAVIIAVFVTPVLQIYGDSMTPTLDEGEIVVAVKGDNFKTGDVIAFYYNNKILIKRVIAQPGEWVNIDQDGTVYVNNTEIDEPYVSGKSMGECDLILPYQVPESRVFVMGDHRDVSIDSRSRSIGCVADEQIVGKVIFRIWPLSQVGGVR